MVEPVRSRGFPCCVCSDDEDDEPGDDPTIFPEGTWYPEDCVATLRRPRYVQSIGLGPNERSTVDYAFHHDGMCPEYLTHLATPSSITIHKTVGNAPPLSPSEEWMPLFQCKPGTHDEVERQFMCNRGCGSPWTLLGPSAPRAVVIRCRRVGREDRGGARQRFKFWRANGVWGSEDDYGVVVEALPEPELSEDDAELDREPPHEYPHDTFNVILFRCLARERTSRSPSDKLAVAAINKALRSDSRWGYVESWVRGRVDPNFGVRTYYAFGENVTTVYSLSADAPEDPVREGVGVIYQGKPRAPVEDAIVEAVTCCYATMATQTRCVAKGSARKPDRSCGCARPRHELGPDGHVNMPDRYGWIAASAGPCHAVLSATGRYERRVDPPEEPLSGSNMAPCARPIRDTARRLARGVENGNVCLLGDEEVDGGRSGSPSFDAAACDYDEEYAFKVRASRFLRGLWRWRAAAEDAAADEARAQEAADRERLAAAADAGEAAASSPQASTSRSPASGRARGRRERPPPDAPPSVARRRGKRDRERSPVVARQAAGAPRWRPHRRAMLDDPTGDPRDLEEWHDEPEEGDVYWFDRDSRRWVTRAGPVRAAGGAVPRRRRPQPGSDSYPAEDLEEDGAEADECVMTAGGARDASPIRFYPCVRRVEAVSDMRAWAVPLCGSVADGMVNAARALGRRPRRNSHSRPASECIVDGETYERIHRHAYNSPPDRPLELCFMAFIGGGMCPTTRRYFSCSPRNVGLLHRELADAVRNMAPSCSVEAYPLPMAYVFALARVECDRANGARTCTELTYAVGGSTHCMKALFDSVRKLSTICVEVAVAGVWNLRIVESVPAVSGTPYRCVIETCSDGGSSCTSTRMVSCKHVASLRLHGEEARVRDSRSLCKIPSQDQFVRDLTHGCTCRRTHARHESQYLLGLFFPVTGMRLLTTDVKRALGEYCRRLWEWLQWGAGSTHYDALRRTVPLCDCFLADVVLTNNYYGYGLMLHLHCLPPPERENTVVAIMAAALRDAQKFSSSSLHIAVEEHACR